MEQSVLTGAQALVRALEELGVDDGVRHPGRRDPAGLRPAARLQADPAHPGPARAGRRPRGRPATRRPPAGSACAWPPRARARPTWSRRSPTPTWTRCRWWRSPARSPASLIGTDAFQEADICGITMPITKHNFLVTKRRGHPAHHRRGVPHRLHRPARARCWSTSPRTRCRPRTDFSWPVALDLPGYRPVTQAARQADARGRPADRRGQAPGALRRRRRAQGARRPRSCGSSPS